MIKDINYGVQAITNNIVDLAFGDFNALKRIGTNIIPTMSNKSLHLLTNAFEGQPQNVIACAMAIRECEGTANAKGYNTMFSYQYFDDYTKHPNKVITKGGHSSSAAGAYQIITATWNETSKAWGIKDFTPESQDKWFIECLKRRRKCYDDVVNGHWDNALTPLALEWASVPCEGNHSDCKRHSFKKGVSHWGQGGKSKTQFLSLIKKYGGIV